MSHWRKPLQPQRNASPSPPPAHTDRASSAASGGADEGSSRRKAGRESGEMRGSRKRSSVQMQRGRSQPVQFATMRRQGGGGAPNARQGMSSMFLEGSTHEEEEEMVAPDHNAKVAKTLGLDKSDLQTQVSIARGRTISQVSWSHDGKIDGVLDDMALLDVRVTLRSLPDLAELFLSNNSFTRVGLSALAEGILSHLPKLHSLSLVGNHLKAEPLAEMLQQWEHCMIKSLDLSHNQLRENCSVLWAQLFRPGVALSQLRLQHCGLDAGSAASLADALMNYGDSLRLLDLEGNLLGPKGATTLVHGIVDLKIVTLNLKACGIASRNVLRKFASKALGGNSKVSSAQKLQQLLLCTLSLEEVTLGDAALENELRTHFNSNRLAKHNSGATFTARGWTSLPRALLTYYEHLSSLDISCNQLHCVPYSILQLRSLKLLDISRNQIHSSSMPIHLVLMPNLQHLDVRHNPFTQALPDSVRVGDTKSVLFYWRGLTSRSDMVPDYRRQVVVLGDSKAGKSSLVSNILKVGTSAASSNILKRAKSRKWGKGETFAPLSIRRRVFHSVGDSYEVSFWDMDSSVINYPTHQFFLLPGALYIVCFSLEKPQEEMLSSIDRWVNTVTSRMEQAEFLLVGTHGDRASQETDLGALLKSLSKRYKRNRRVRVVGAHLVDTAVLKDVIAVYDTLASVIQENDGGVQLVPRCYPILAAVLREEAKVMEVPVINWNRLHEIAKGIGLQEESDLDDVAQYLRTADTILYYDSVAKLRDVVVLDPQWLVLVMSALIDTGLPVVQESEVSRIFCFPHFKRSAHAAVLRILEAFEITHPLRVGSSTRASPRLIVPSLLTLDFLHLSPLPDMPKKHESYRRVYELEQPPSGLASQLLVRLLHVTNLHCKCSQRQLSAALDAPDGLTVFHFRMKGSKLKFAVYTTETSGRSLHIISTTVETLLRGWYAGLSFKRYAKLPTGEKVDLDHISELMMSIHSVEQLHEFSHSQGVQFALPDLLLTQEAKINSRDLVVEKEIGAGAFGTVSFARIGGKRVVVKRLRGADFMQMTQPALYALFLQEVWMMSFLKHPRIVALEGISFDPPSILMEYATEGDLRKFLNGVVPLSFPASLQLSILSDIASGMDFAHSQFPRIIHRDLKSPNVLLTLQRGELIAKVADLGLAQVLPKSSKGCDVDNPVWAAPEVISNGVLSEKIDVWSFAIIMWEVLNPGLFPYDDHLKKLKFMRLVGDAIVEEGLRPTLTEEVVASAPPGYVELMQQCWSRAADARPSFSDIVLSLHSMSSAVQQQEGSVRDEEARKGDRVGGLQLLTQIRETSNASPLVVLPHAQNTVKRDASSEAPDAGFLVLWDDGSLEELSLPYETTVLAQRQASKVLTRGSLALINGAVFVADGTSKVGLIDSNEPTLLSSMMDSVSFVVSGGEGLLIAVGVALARTAVALYRLEDVAVASSALLERMYLLPTKVTVTDVACIEGELWLLLDGARIVVVSLPLLEKKQELEVGSAEAVSLLWLEGTDLLHVMCRDGWLFINVRSKQVHEVKSVPTHGSLLARCYVAPYHLLVMYLSTCSWIMIDVSGHANGVASFEAMYSSCECPPFPRALYYVRSLDGLVSIGREGLRIYKVKHRTSDSFSAANLLVEEVERSDMQELLSRKTQEYIQLQSRLLQTKQENLRRITTSKTGARSSDKSRAVRGTLPSGKFSRVELSLSDESAVSSADDSGALTMGSRRKGARRGANRNSSSSSSGDSSVLHGAEEKQKALRRSSPLNRVSAARSLPAGGSAPSSPTAKKPLPSPPLERRSAQESRNRSSGLVAASPMAKRRSAAIAAARKPPQLIARTSAAKFPAKNPPTRPKAEDGDGEMQEDSSSEEVQFLSPKARTSAAEQPQGPVEEEEDSEDLLWY